MPDNTPPSYFFISLMNGAAWGGSEELWYKTAIHLAGKGIKVGCAVYNWKEKEGRLHKLKEAGCALYLLPVRIKRKEFFINKLLRKRAYNIALKEAIKALPVEAYTTVIINQGGFEVYTNVWENFNSRSSNYILLFHNYDEQQVFSGIKKQRLRKWIQQASKNLFAARQMQAVLQKQLAIEITNAAVFINPITFQPPEQPLPYPPLQNGQIIFSVFAALDVNRKAQHKLVKILSSDKWKQRPWLLNFYGEGRDREALEKQITAAGLQDKVFLKGYTVNVVDAIKNSHLILQLTDIDAMPLSVIEAMAVGRPLAVTQIGDMPLWVHHGVNGWVTTTDEASIEACLEEAWQQRDQWSEMGGKSFDIFQQQFSGEVEAHFLQLLDHE